MAERSGVEIDYCPQCRGIWLDSGELDKIIDRQTAGHGAQGQPANPKEPQIPQQYQQPQQGQRNNPYHYKSGEQGAQGQRVEHHHYKHEEKESWLERVFDVFD